MARNFQAVALIPAVIWLALRPEPAAAQLQLPTSVTGVQINYQEPANPAHRAIYERLKQRQVLEQYREFMSPVKFKTPLTVAIEGCNGTINAWYNSGTQKITYCYELIADLENSVAKAAQLPGFRREDAIVGGFVQILLHETAHAMFDLLDIPIFGREEDAADALSEFTLLRLGPNVARRALTGTAFIWRAFGMQEARPRGFEDFSDEHGTNAQRFYNALCIAYGSDLIEGTKTFTDFVQQKLLPEERRGHCANEYRHAKISFERLILPHIDLELMKKVQATEWLKNEDGTDVLPPSGAPGPGLPQIPGVPGPGGPPPGGGPGGPTVPGPGPGPGPGPT
jgi:hypothetical protein